MNLRPARLADLPAILALQQSCAGAPHWTEPIWWSLLHQQESFIHHREALLAEEALPDPSPALLGFIVTTVTADIAEIEDICVQPTARRRGIARALCAAAMAAAARRGAIAMQLEVRALNTAACALYASLGFARQGTRRAYYRDPTDDAVLMSASLSPSPTGAAKV